MAALQAGRLRDCVAHAGLNVALYRERLGPADLGPEDVRTVDDLAKLPFTVKQDLRDHYPYGLFAVPLSEVVRINALCSGTTGKMTVVGYTANDVAMWADLVARALSIAGADRNDVIHVAYGYGLFTGGLGLHTAANGWGDGGAGVGGEHAAAGGTGAGLRGDRAVLHTFVFAADRGAGCGGRGGPEPAEAGVFVPSPVGGDAFGDRGALAYALDIYGLSR
ncbi:Phenylacetate-coenzyme A ligase [Geodia barretti]|uniref:Phenylacetate-coenzyme A ligase n=1 Tax=Geodia barretti TaxID=519541 RepID=A0AA35TVB5_GEOBA|nr:Phenylacetate-coenzyme A ligase [Geodia barretti]